MLLLQFIFLIIFLLQLCQSSDDVDLLNAVEKAKEETKEEVKGTIDKVKSAVTKVFKTLTTKLTGGKEPIKVSSNLAKSYQDLAKINIPYPTVDESDIDEMDDYGEMEDLKRTRLKYSLSQQASYIADRIISKTPSATPLGYLLKALARRVDLYKRMYHKYKEELNYQNVYPKTSEDYTVI
ncbi:hypothetical protein SNEBB_005593 [Seison nebaliae]|nr:hypothetical protein SNEBB_005593 [Seison nebaliae]